MRLNIVSVFPAALSLLLLLFGAYWWGHSVLDPAYVSSTGLLGGGGLGVAESQAWLPCLFISWMFGLSAAFFGRRYRLALLNTLIYGVIGLESWEIATSRSLDLPLHGVAVLLFLVPLAVVFASAILPLCSPVIRPEHVIRWGSAGIYLRRGPDDYTAKVRRLPPTKTAPRRSCPGGVPRG